MGDELKRPATRRTTTRAVAKPAARVAARRPARRPGFLATHALPWLRAQWRVVLGLTLLVVFVHDVFGEKGVLAMRRSQQEVEKLQQEIQKLNEENENLADHVQRLKTDPELIERIAREQMGLARPGEYVYKLPQQETTTEKK
jgi:cell division protein FtsB